MIRYGVTVWYPSGMGLAGMVNSLREKRVLLSHSARRAAIRRSASIRRAAHWTSGSLLQAVERHQQLVPLGDHIERVKPVAAGAVKATLADTNRLAQPAGVGQLAIVSWLVAQKRERRRQRAVYGPNRRTTAIVGLQNEFEASRLNVELGHGYSLSGR